MAEYITTVTQKGQVTIPGDLRQALGLKPRDKVAFALHDGKVVLYPVQSPVLATYGAVKAKNRPENYQRIRREIEEEEVATEVTSEV